MKKRSCGLFVLVLLMIMGFVVGSATAGTLWYNGDLDSSGSNQWSNHHIFHDYGGSKYFQSDAHVYDDFVVSAGGWTVNSVWSNNLFTGEVNFLGATYEIRSGVSAGNGGTVVSSGSGTVSLTATGRGYDGKTEYKVQISGLNIDLDPGRYWLNVTPTIDLDDEYSYNSVTIGTNAVGLPAGDNGNSYQNVHVHYAYGGGSSTIFTDTEGKDFSMGIAGEGSPVPIPGALWLLGSGLFGLVTVRRRKNHSA